MVHTGRIKVYKKKLMMKSSSFSLPVNSNECLQERPETLWVGVLAGSGAAGYCVVGSCKREREPMNQIEIE